MQMYTLRGPNDNTGIDVKIYIGIKSLMETRHEYLLKRKLNDIIGIYCVFTIDVKTNVSLQNQNNNLI